MLRTNLETLEHVLNWAEREIGQGELSRLNAAKGWVGGLGEEEAGYVLLLAFLCVELHDRSKVREALEALEVLLTPPQGGGDN